MALGEPIESGLACPRGRYRISSEDLENIQNAIERATGTPNGYVVYDLRTVQKELGGGTQANAGCVSYYLNKIIEDNPDLKAFSIYAHSHKGNIRFDRKSE
jgi:hypothetical protein